MEVAFKAAIEDLGVRRSASAIRTLTTAAERIADPSFVATTLGDAMMAAASVPRLMAVFYVADSIMKALRGDVVDLLRPYIQASFPRAWTGASEAERKELYELEAHWARRSLVAIHHGPVQMDERYTHCIVCGDKFEPEFCDRTGLWFYQDTMPNPDTDTSERAPIVHVDCVACVMSFKRS